MSRATTAPKHLTRRRSMTDDEKCSNTFVASDAVPVLGDAPHAEPTAERPPWSGLPRASVHGCGRLVLCGSVDAEPPSGGPHLKPEGQSQPPLTQVPPLMQNRLLPHSSLRYWQLSPLYVLPRRGFCGHEAAVRRRARQRRACEGESGLGRGGGTRCIRVRVSRIRLRVAIESSCSVVADDDLPARRGRCRGQAARTVALLSDTAGHAWRGTQP